MNKTEKAFVLKVVEFMNSGLSYKEAVTKTNTHFNDLLHNLRDALVHPRYAKPWATKANRKLSEIVYTDIRKGA